MLVQEIIRKKRDGILLTDNEISWFISQMTQDKMSESQIAAFAMATYLKGMNISERTTLTEAMCNSGKKIQWDLAGPIIDKHSTGGVGDCVSLLLAPSLAACGGFVPMVSGRGLGHTGGTLDKFDSIPGYESQPSIELFKKTVKTVGCAIVGQTEEIAPADKRLYAIRDVTATVESVDLITASILSKKLAAGLDALVLDIKCGNGAFMDSLKQAELLARSLVQVGNGLGCHTTAILTDMNQPLCSNVGNSLEMQKAVDILKGNAKENRLLEVVSALGGKILWSVGLASSFKQGSNKIRNSFENGRSAELFERMISSLGGSNNFLNKSESELPSAPFVADVNSFSTGYIHSIDSRAIGISVLELGGARRRSTDIIDHAVGFENLLGVGDFIDSKLPLARIHARDEQSLALAKDRILRAYKIGEQKKGKENGVIIKQLD